MGCGHRGHHHGRRREGRHHGRSCDCGGPGHFGRRFWTKEEKIARLEQYLEDLRQEAKAVEEHIAGLRGE